MIEKLSTVNRFWIDHIRDFALPLHFARLMSVDYLETMAEGLRHHQNQDKEKARDCFQKAQRLGTDSLSDSGFALHLELLFCEDDKTSPEYLEKFQSTLDQAPTCAEYVYNRGVLALQRNQMLQALQDFEKALTLNPSLKEAHKALGILYTLMGRWTEAEAALLTSLEGVSDHSIGDLCLFAAQHALGKETGPLFQLDPSLCDKNFSFFYQDHGEKFLSYLPPVNKKTYKHSVTSPYILFLACDSKYFYEHTIPLLGSLATLNQPIQVHLHLFNPTKQLWKDLKEILPKVSPVSVQTSFEMVNTTYYGIHPGIYYSAVRFCRFYEVLQENIVPVLMIDVDSLVRHDLSQLPGLLDSTKEIGLCYLENEPLWNQMAAGIFYAKPTPMSKTFLSFLTCFIISNIQKGTARWFLDQVGLAFSWKQWGPQLSPQFLDHKTFLSTIGDVNALLWTVVNQQKLEDSPYNLLKAHIIEKLGSYDFSPQEPFNQVHNGKYGFIVYNKNDQFIGLSIQNQGTWCDHEIRAMSDFIQPGDTVLDVGANIGNHTLAFANLVGPHGKVLSFEAQPLVYQSLISSVSLNSLENVRCYQVAVGNTMGTLNVPLLDPYHPQQNFGGMSFKTPHLPSLLHEKIPLITLDSLNLEACHLIKIDVEGMELEVLEGATQTIARCHPVLYLENHEGAQNPFIQLLTQWGYKIYKHGTDQDPNNLCLPPHRLVEGAHLEQVA